MNENPWRVDDIARMQRERIQEEMRQIRILEAANRAHAPRLGLAARIAAQLYMGIQKWLHPARKAPRGLEPQPQVRLHAKPHARA